MIKSALSSNMIISREVIQASLISHAEAFDNLKDKSLIVVEDINQYISSHGNLFTVEELSVLFDTSIKEMEVSLFIKVDHSLVNTIKFINNEKF